MKTSLVRIVALSVALSVSAAPTLAKKAGSGASKADYRSAKSGKYVKKGYAEKNKDTTVREERKKQ